MKILQTVFDEIEIFKNIRASLKEKGLVQITGCVPSQTEHMIYGLGMDYDMKIIVTYEESRALEILGNYRAFDPNATYYPAIDPMFHKADIQGNFISEQRMEVIKDLYSGKNFTIVTTPEAFEDKLSSFTEMQQNIITVKKGGSVNEEELSEQLVDMGYEHESQVTAHGEFSVRGNIIDVYPFTEDAPFRIDLWGEEVESIKYFDTETQRSIAEVEEIDIFPGGGKVWEERTDEGVGFLEYFKDKNVFFAIDDPVKTFEDHDEVKEELFKNRCVLFSMFEDNLDEYEIKEKFTVKARNVVSYNGRFLDLAEDLKTYKLKKYRVILFAATQSRADNLVKNLNENGVSAFSSSNDELELLPGQILVTPGSLKTGFEYPDIRFSIMSEVDIFGKRRQKRKKRKRYTGDPIKDFADLNVGDYVVHENHGIGVYAGIERLMVDGSEKDYMKIEYAKNDSLFVLATDFDKIQKYAGSDAIRPKINRIGGKDWINTKEKVSKAVQDIAEELVKLYAVRQARQGYQYSPDTIWQTEFEGQFEFEETDDQLKAIEEVKADMESTRIMDRLICGDVGFGKTEVAIRAAFKAVQEGRQAAFLVPTTVLAQQHYNTIMKRVENYPVTVKMLSRFSTSKEQKETLKDLENGMADIVVGTHRLLSDDVKFKDLGLLVVDEEQRFGVKHKEKIKNLRKDVDVLTLSATPIPRTLHMSLSGIRDMSLLTEPPVDRVPIQTYVMEYSEEAVREAILREAKRGGQVYYIYNRVGNIDIVADRISQMVPDLNVECAHGQMRARDLEQIMEEFIAGNIDVLVSTTIVETGLDISNVNTIIVHDADKFGLSQLYQLRGRVGRSNRTAYAFLLYRRDKLIKEVAEKRLKAIREFSDLGSGIRIAMRDLEIRGAGNLLGAEQSGHMEAVGYELYCKMLNRAVMLLKGEEIPEEFDTTIDLSIDGYISSEYIKNEFEKLNMYKKISAVESKEDLEDIQEELIDRFGPVPKEVGNLLAVSLIRAKAHQVFVTEVSGSASCFKITMFRNAPVDVEKMSTFLTKYRDTVKFTSDKTEYFTYRPRKIPGSVKAVQDTLLEFFAIMKNGIF